MSGTTDHEAAVADLPENSDDGKFFFSLQADENGVTELKFRKQADRVFGTMLFTLDYINQSFDVPYATVSEFIDTLSAMAKHIEERHAANKEAANDEGNASPDAPTAG